MSGVFVAIPAYDGGVRVETVRALLAEQHIALGEGVPFSVSFIAGCSLITQVRNQMCADFLASAHDRMVFVDSDVAWEPGSLLRVASHKVDICGGAYRKKLDREEYPVRWLVERDELWADPETGLLEVGGLPGGFLCITRAALMRFQEAYPERRYTFEDRPFHAYFTMPFKDGYMWGEDMAFCDDMRNAGVKVWLDPELDLRHIGGTREHPGRIGAWLRNR